MPSGFALEDVPGLPRMGDVRRAAAHAAASGPAARKSLVATLLPLALVIAGAFLLWSYFNNRQRPQEAGSKAALDEAEADRGDEAGGARNGRHSVGGRDAKQELTECSSRSGRTLPT